MIQIVQQAQGFSERTAIRSYGQNYSYQTLLEKSEQIALHLLNGRADLNEVRIAFIVNPSFEYVAVQWAIWRAGGIAVPLCVSHPYASIKYVIEDTGAESVIFTKAFQELVSPIAVDFQTSLIDLDEIGDTVGQLPDVHRDRRAMILYTSGTTGQPKGVVTTHKNIETQISSLVEAWEWNQGDQILNLLPLHHVHGIINVLSCALWSGACCEFLPKFDAGTVFDIFLGGRINVFMAVPTIYYKLIAHWQELPVDEQGRITEALGKFRLMVSGSAALPVSTLEKWQEVSGHILLERYGMTEIGMAISNPYRGVRKPGHIGMALAGVQVRLADEEDKVVEGEAGEIQVKGDNVFLEYWNKEEATRSSFTKDGWFKTGDIAVIEDGYYKILGRNSVDIIKSGGYKISALEIEEVLRTNEAIKDCAVIGIPDAEWGEIIGAVIVPSEGKVLPDNLKSWLMDRLPKYKIPRSCIALDELPRNAMGKVTKKELQPLFQES